MQRVPVCFMCINLLHYVAARLYKALLWMLRNRKSLKLFILSLKPMMDTIWLLCLKVHAVNSFDARVYDHRGFLDMVHGLPLPVRCTVNGISQCSLLVLSLNLCHSDHCVLIVTHIHAFIHDQEVSCQMCSKCP